MMQRVQQLATTTMSKSVIKNCKLHGDYTVDVFYKTCTQCQHDKNILQQEHALALQNELIRSNRLKARLPQKFSESSFLTYKTTFIEQKKVKVCCEQYASQLLTTKNSNLILYGSIGTGKTHLACAIAHYVIDNNMTVIFKSAADFFDEIRWSFDDKKFNQYQLIKDLVMPDLAIIDDVGMQYKTDFEMLSLFKVINKRYENNKATLLTTNLNRVDLIKVVGERSYDRLMEGGQLVKLAWQSYRQQ